MTKAALVLCVGACLACGESKTPGDDGIDQQGDQDAGGDNDSNTEGDGDGAPGDGDGGGFINATFTGTNAIVIGEPLAVTVTLDTAATRDVTFTWRILGVTSEFPAEAAVLSNSAAWGSDVPGVGEPRSTVVPAGQTVVTETFATGTAGLARPITLHFQAESDAVQGVASLDVTVSPRSTDVRSASSAIGYFRLRHDGTVTHSDTREGTQSIIPNLPPLRLWANGGSELYAGVTNAGALIHGFQQWTTLDVEPETVADYDASTVATIYPGYFAFTLFGARSDRYYYSQIRPELESGEGVIDVAHGWATGRSYYAKADGTILHSVNDGAPQVVTTEPGVVHIAAPYESLFTLTESGVLTRRICTATCSTPRDIDVVSGLPAGAVDMVASTTHVFIVYADGSVLRVTADSDTEPDDPLVAASASEQFAHTPLQLFGSLCALVVGNTIECL